MTYFETNALQGIIASLTDADNEQKWTPRKLAEFVGIGGLGPIFVGAAQKVADQLEDWMAETDVDGFNLAYITTPGTFEDIVTYVVPELQKRGLFKTSYAEGTLREKLALNDSASVHVQHPAYRYKKLKQSLQL